MPKVSVIIPSFNHATYIADAVKSVIAQTMPDWELIVVDDGSTDQSLAILAKLTDPRLKIISQSNQGAHAAINHGLQEACGEYFAILNSDDAYHPKRLEKLLAVLQSEPEVGLVGSDIQIIDSQGKPLGIKHGYADCSPWPLPAPERSFRAGNDWRATLLTENYWSTTSNYMFPRWIFDQVGEFRPLRYVHDWDFALRVAKVARTTWIPEPLMEYRIHDTNTIRDNQAAMIFEICWSLAVHLPTQTAEAWFHVQPPQQRLDQLLHSIYTFNLDRVLAVMLVQNLAADPHQAERLLDPSDPSRQCYLAYIQTFLAEHSQVPPVISNEQGGYRRVLRTFKRRFIHLLGQ